MNKNNKTQLEEKVKELKKENKRLRRSHRKMRLALKSIKERNNLGLDFKRGKKFARHLAGYIKITDYIQISTMDQPLDPPKYKEDYEWFKEVIKNWTLKDLQIFIKELANSYYNLSIQKTYAKCYTEIMNRFNSLYEWAMNIPNDYVHLINKDGKLTRIPKALCLWTDNNQNKIQNGGENKNGKKVH